MKEVSTRYIYFSLGENNTVKFQSWNIEYYDSDAGTIITAFLPSALSSSVAAADAYSTLSADRKTITMYPYFYVSGVVGWGLQSVTFVLDSATVPEI